MTELNPDPVRRAAAAAAVLADWQDPETGTWPDCWWQSANALESLIDYARLTGDTAYDDRIGRTFVQAQTQAAGFLNVYYDDEGWWGIAWLKAYDRTGQDRYLEAARQLFEDMAGGWDATRGGVWWTKEKSYRNAIPNELFLVLAARLHQRTKEGVYLEWAQREWDWFRASGMLNDDGLVNDGLTPEGRNNGGVTWTYNQGVILGGLVELHRATGKDDLLTTARRIADAATSLLVSADGILREPCEDPAFGRACDGDQELFKGIFVRYLAQLAQACDEPAYRQFVRRNADALWQSGRGDQDRFGLRWSGPFDGASVQRQTAALDLFNAAIQDQATTGF